MNHKKYLIAALCLGIAAPSVMARATFNKTKDILVAQFDSAPDPDDIQAQAALGSILAHTDYQDVNFYAVQGAIGTQGYGKFIDSDALFNMAFGTGNWTDAKADWSGSVTRIKNKVKPILQNGGKVWVQEAGQSNITADWIAALLNDGVAASTVKANVIVVQHSQWNIDKTTPSDLSYVQSKATWQRIDDGNKDPQYGDPAYPDTPGYKTTDKSFLQAALNSPNAKAKQLWTEAKRVTDGAGVEDWPHIGSGGLDYSDCVENWWILEIPNAGTVTEFWNKFVVNDTGTTVNDLTAVNGGEISAGATGSVTVNYTASQASRIVVNLRRKADWLLIGSQDLNVNAGSGNVSASVAVPTDAVAGEYTWYVWMAPQGGNWASRVDEISKVVTLDVSQPSIDDLIAVNGSDISAGATGSVTVDYTASQSIRIVVNLRRNSDWLLIGSENLYVGAGSGSVSASVAVPANAAAGEYTWYVWMTAQGGNWASRIDEISKVVTLGTTSSGRVPENPANTVEGINYSYYEGTWDLLPNFSALTPVTSGTTSQFDLTPALSADYYGLVFTGYIQIPATGTYTFYTLSDDGSKLFIGNTEVIDNDGLHWNREISGSIELQAGKHAITVEFFEKTGGNVLQVYWEGPGISKQLIPSTVLFR